MSPLASLYTSENTRFSAPLQWSVTLFWRETEHQQDWLSQFSSDLEPDDIRVLNHRFYDDKTSQFLLSTLPKVSPSTIVQRTKGRLYYRVRKRKPKPFRGNYSLRSIGKVTRETVENYVADQLGQA